MEAYPKSYLKTALLMGITLLIMLTALTARESPRGPDVPISLAVDPPLTTPIAAPAAAPASPSPASPARTAGNGLAWRAFQTRPGDSLSTVFSRAGLSARDLQGVMHAGKQVATLKHIKPGERIAMQIDATGNLQALRYHDSAVRNLLVVRQGQGYRAKWQAIQPQILIGYATGAITPATPTLYQAAKGAGLPDSLVMKLANIFQWDVSFALDLRQGDSFTLLYQEKYVDGKKIGDGDILAAEFNNHGKHYQAVFYRDPQGRSGYYAPDGASMKKAFLRDPVHFKYISSGFNPHRMHPIFHRIMPHWGVDFAAAKGTPVRASGDGRVTIARQNAASGRYIVIQHGREYTTKYLHLSAFARGIRPGTRVTQGQVIGYVGQTGWATAPHLHYEFLVNGVHENPMTVALPKAAPIPAAELPRFKRDTQPLLAKLDSIAGKTGYALAAEAGTTVVK